MGILRAAYDLLVGRVTAILTSFYIVYQAINGDFDV